MRGLATIVQALIDAAGGHLPPWAAPAFILALVALLYPYIRKNQHTDAARKLLRMAARESGSARDKLEAEALAQVDGHPVGLVVVADDALRNGRTKLAEQALAKLKATGKGGEDARRIERILEGPQPANAIEAALRIERLLAQNMRDEARGRLAKWRARWPDDEDLRALEEKVAERPA